MPALSKRNIALATLLVLLVALTLFPGNIARAQGPKPGDKFIFGGTYTLASGEILDGDLVLMGGAVTIETNATVEGDVAVIGGTADIDGKVNGDIIALGGAINLGPHAEIDGDATAIGGIIDRAPTAQVYGNIVETNPQDESNAAGRIQSGDIQVTPVVPGQWQQDVDEFIFQHSDSNPLGWLARLLLHGMAAIAWTAILAALGVLMVLLAPRPTERVANAIRHDFRLAFAVGLAASLLAIPLILLLTITICLIPLAMAIPLILFVAWLFGWLALGWLIGHDILKNANTANSTPIWEVLVGVSILTLLWQLPTIIPFVGSIISALVLFIAGNIAIGSVLLTRFGLRDYPETPPFTAELLPAPEDTLPPASTLSGP